MRITFAGMAASPVSVMKRLLRTRAVTSRSRGPREGRLLVVVRTSAAGNRTIAMSEITEITADTTKERR